MVTGVRLLAILFFQALIRHHPDRFKPDSIQDLTQEVEREETFKLLVHLRDKTKEKLEQ